MIYVTVKIYLTVFLFQNTGFTEESVSFRTVGNTNITRNLFRTFKDVSYFFFAFNIPIP